MNALFFMVKIICIIANFSTFRVVSSPKLYLIFFFFIILLRLFSNVVYSTVF